MNGPKPIPPGWSGGRFWLVAALLLAGQAGWVLLLGERPRPPHHAVAPRVVLRLLDTPLDDEQLTKHFFASDPTVFPSFSPHGFADQAGGGWPKDEPIVHCRDRRRHFWLSRPTGRARTSRSRLGIAPDSVRVGRAARTAAGHRHRLSGVGGQPSGVVSPHCRRPGRPPASIRLRFCLPGPLVSWSPIPWFNLPSIAPAR